MSTGVVLLIVFVAVVLLFVAGGLAMAKGLKARSEAAKERVRAETGGRATVFSEPANLFGIKSRGKGQVRGNCHVALTDEVFTFSMIVPLRTVTVPRSEITGVRSERSYLGKTVVKPLLVVTWTDDEAAFLVRDLDRWLEALQPG